MKTPSDRHAAAQGWRDAVDSFNDPNDDGSASYAEGWIRGAFVTALGVLRKQGLSERLIELLATEEAALPPIDGSY